MLYFIRGEPDWLIGPTPVGVIGSFGYALLAALIFFSVRALAPTASPPPVAVGSVEAAAQPR
jgi:hypothetical protein